MKIQDIVLFLLLAVLLIAARKPRIFVGVGLLLLVLSMPLFYLQIFFTAQRLVYFSALFIFVGVIFEMVNLRNEKE